MLRLLSVNIFQMLNFKIVKLLNILLYIERKIYVLYIKQAIMR